MKQEESLKEDMELAEKHFPYTETWRFHQYGDDVEMAILEDRRDVEMQRKAFIEGRRSMRSQKN